MSAFRSMRRVFQGVEAANYVVFKLKDVNFKRVIATTSYVSADKKLFTPGPLGVTLTVKEAMLRDLGSRDVTFINTVKFIRSKLIEIAGVSADKYTSIPLQGSGTYAVEAVIQTTTPRTNGDVLVLENGAYGKRIGKICQSLGVEFLLESFPEDARVDVKRVEEILKSGRKFTNVAIIHHETSSGVVNPIKEVGQLVKQYLRDACYLVDGMSSFGAMTINIEECHIDYLVSSANKCIEGVPGFSFAIARLEHLLTCSGQSRSLSLDLFDQYDNLERTSQFRFTPPTHTMLAFRQALKEFEIEGGVQGRGGRYKANHQVLREGMRQLGFKELLDKSHEGQGYMITSFHYPKHPKFDFHEFYRRLSDKDQVIYPGKVLNLNCFRIGNIGQLYPTDMEYLIKCIKEVCADMDIALPLQC